VVADVPDNRGCTQHLARASTSRSRTPRDLDPHPRHAL
jgi:hypothetical protein